MDVVERLTLEAAAAETTLAAAHVQRYEFAAQLCGGCRVTDVCCGSGYGSRILAQTATAVLGVDIDVATVDLASVTVGRDPRVSFMAMDAVAFLGSEQAEAYDTIVMFEGLEHLDEPLAALDLLRSHAERGCRIVLSVPNSEAFEERSPFHRTQFGFATVRETFSGFDRCVILTQFLGEGALILGASPEIGRLALLDHAEPEYANTFIACINVDEGELSQSAARMHVTVSPTHNRYMIDLERANRELRRTNAELARLLLRRKLSTPKVESAAAGVLGRLAGSRARVAELETELRVAQELRGEAEDELARLRSIAAEMNDARQQIIDRMERTRIWRLGQRYWSMRDWLKRGGRAG